MNLLATAVCVDIHQRIKWTEKIITETTYQVKLFTDRLTFKDEMVPISAVFDISYKKKPDKTSIGFLYIHTHYGLKTFLIKERPITFIETFKGLKHSNQC